MSGPSKVGVNFLNICIGSLIILVGSVIVGGEQGPLIVGLTIICTAGVSLVIWIPLAWVLGKITMSLLKPFYIDRRPEAPHIASTEEKSQTVLNSYLQRVLDSGQDVEEAVILLMSNGWEENTIRDAISAMTTAGNG